MARQTKETLAAKKKAYAAAHREEIAARKKAHRAAHRTEEAARRKAHRATITANQRARRAAHREEVRAKENAYRAANPEKARARDRAYRAANPEKVAAKQRAHNAAHPEKVLAKYKKYRVAHPDKGRIDRHNRAARKIGNGGTYTAAEWRALCAWFGNVCLCCDAGGRLTVDHVVPLSRGGTNAIVNLQPLCLSCNMRKHAKPIDYRDPVRLAAFLLSMKGNEDAI